MFSERGLYKRRAPQCGAPLTLTFNASPVSLIVAAGSTIAPSASADYLGDGRPLGPRRAPSVSGMLVEQPK